MSDMQHPFDEELTADVNAHIHELAQGIDSSHQGKHRWSFMCECGAAGCQEHVLLTLGEYKGLKTWGRPIVAAGHAPHRSAST